MTNAEIEWSALERREHTHRPDWYWAVGIIALSIAATAALLHNILFAVLIVVSVIALFLRTLQKPREVAYALTAKGFHTGSDFTPWSALESFWIHETEHEPKLLIKPIALISPLFIIPLDGADRENLRGILSERLSETELHEPLSKKIMEFLGF